MIEKTLLDYLSAALKEPVFMEVPEKATGAFFVLEKTGSGRANHINEATIAVQSYASSLAKAAEMNERAKAALDRCAELDAVCRVNLNTDYNFTDTASKRYRYQAVFDVAHY